MAWVTQANLENLVGTTAVSSLGLSTAGILAQFEGAARGRCIAVMQHAGYAAPDTTVDTSTVSGAFLSHLCACVILRDAYQLRKGIGLPSAAASAISEGIGALDAIYDKRLPIPGMEPVAFDGFGGTKGSPIIGTDARPARMGPGKLTGM